MPNPNTAAPARQRVLTSATPKIEDIVFFERHDSTIAKNAVGSLRREYGRGHPIESEFPKHRLAFIEPDDQKGWEKWWYVADREDQDDYNFEISYPYGGLKDFPRYKRTYIIPRADYAPLAKGTADPTYTDATLISEEQVRTGERQLDNLYVVVVREYDYNAPIANQDTYNAEYSYPYNGDTDYPRTTRKYLVPRADLDTIVFPATDPDDAEAFFAFQQVSRVAGNPLDSLYVEVTRTYDRVPNLTDVTDEAFLESFGFSVTRPHGASANPSLTWRVPLPKSESFSLLGDYTACPITGYTALLLTDETMENAPDNAASVAIVRVYSSLPGPELGSATVETFPQIPNAFITEQTTTISRVPKKNDAALEVVDGGITDPGGAKIQSSVGASGNSRLVFNQGAVTLEVSTGVLSGQRLDPDTNTLLDFTEEIVAAGTAGVATDANGIYSEVRPLNQEFSIKSTQKATGLVDGDRVYETIINYSWPPVLESILFYPISARGDGIPYPISIGYFLSMKDGYSGPCRAEVTESWSQTAVSVPTFTRMIPTAVSADFILLKNFNIPRCLHGVVSVTETIGNTHPTYPPSVIALTEPATTLVDWPVSIVASFQQAPHKGGFLSKKVVVYPPA